MGKDNIENEGGIHFSIISFSLYVAILKSTHNNDLEIDSGYVDDSTLDEVNLHDSFPFSLFVFDNACICIMSIVSI